MNSGMATHKNEACVAWGKKKKKKKKKLSKITNTTLNDNKNNNYDDNNNNNNNITKNLRKQKVRCMSPASNPL
jgi:ABC-type Fe3+-citrate transport system substrate-binding protein